MGVRGHRRQFGKRKVSFDLERGNGELIRPRLRQQRHVLEQALRRVGEIEIEARGIVTPNPLEKDGRRDQRGFAGLQRKRHPGRHRFTLVVVVSQRFTIGRVDAVDVAAVPVVPDAGAKAEFVLDDRATAGRADLVTRRTALREAELFMREAAVLGQARFVRDEPHRTGFRARAEQGALRTALDFHPLQVEHRRIRIADVSIRGEPPLDGGIVDVDAHRGGPEYRFQSANRDDGQQGCVTIQAEGQSRRNGRQIADALMSACTRSAWLRALMLIGTRSRDSDRRSR